jgi:hypothetical protein
VSGWEGLANGTAGPQSMQGWTARLLRPQGKWMRRQRARRGYVPGIQTGMGVAVREWHGGQNLEASSLIDSDEPLRLVERCLVLSCFPTFPEAESRRVSRRRPADNGHPVDGRLSAIPSRESLQCGRLNANTLADLAQARRRHLATIANHGGSFHAQSVPKPAVRRRDWSP